MVKRALIKYLENYLQYLVKEGFQFEKVFLYGSHATGGNRTDSDIDVLLVDSRFDKPGNDREGGKIWYLTYFFDPRIEPYTIGASKFQNDDASPLIEIVKEEGIEISPQSG